MYSLFRILKFNWHTFIIARNGTNRVVYISQATPVASQVNPRRTTSTLKTSLKENYTLEKTKLSLPSYWESIPPTFPATETFREDKDLNLKPVFFTWEQNNSVIKTKRSPKRRKANIQLHRRAQTSNEDQSGSSTDPINLNYSTM